MRNLSIVLAPPLAAAHNLGFKGGELCDCNMPRNVCTSYLIKLCRFFEESVRPRWVALDFIQQIAGTLTGLHQHLVLHRTESEHLSLAIGVALTRHTCLAVIAKSLPLQCLPCYEVQIGRNKSIMRLGGLVSRRCSLNLSHPIRPRIRDS
jgi:hypothetical protein